MLFDSSFITAGVRETIMLLVNKTKRVNALGHVILLDCLLGIRNNQTLIHDRVFR